jgi:hemerythrin-like metal-binding protein
MPLIEWDEALVLDGGVIDDTHKEFVDLLNRMHEAPDDELLDILDQFIAHSEAHFGQEQRWMEELEFPPLSCHVREHEGVMEIVREVRRRAAAGDMGYGKILAQGVAEWFANHATSMDLVLARYIKERGYVPTAG